MITEADDKTVTVTCPCGEVWNYKRPRHYGGKAFSDKRCAKCRKNIAVSPWDGNANHID